MPTKILIYVEGGIVQSVCSNQPDTQIVIIDKDNLVSSDDKNGFISGIHQPDGVYENHYEAYNDQSDPIEMEIREELKALKF